MDRPLTSRTKRQQASVAKNHPRPPGLRGVPVKRLQRQEMLANPVPNCRLWFSAQFLVDNDPNKFVLLTERPNVASVLGCKSVLMFDSTFSELTLPCAYSRTKLAGGMSARKLQRCTLACGSFCPDALDHPHRGNVSSCCSATASRASRINATYPQSEGRIQKSVPSRPVRLCLPSHTSGVA